MLFLFTLAQPNKPANGMACALKSELKAADSHKKLKRPCAKKCLKHQTHSEQKNAANVTIDCGQQLFALVHDTQSDLFSTSSVRQQFRLLSPPKLLAPSLGADPDPPRFS
ncbi:hypothetical protein [uncultured Pontibacter sp.]|uniref:hypothetical protein n=1 Tax=uncultured Pontibacter sp. TaxID=453356 RepID=UPI00261F6C37|nr:hypothetical protein [uncultured Pontibacter sp.]